MPLLSAKSNDKTTNSVYDKWSSRLAALRRSLTSPFLPIPRPTAPSNTSGTSNDVISVVVQEAPAPSPVAQSIPVAEGQTRPTRYVPPPVLDYAVGNPGASTLRRGTPTPVDTPGSSRSTEGIRGPFAPPSDASGSLSDQATGAVQSAGMSESTTGDGSYLQPDMISAAIFSTAQNMTVLGGRYYLNVFPPARGGSPNLADTHTVWNRGPDIATDSNNAAVIQTGGNLQEASLPTQQPVLIVSDDLLGTGSCGTVVYKGLFQGRPVAVKRLLRDFATLAEREVSILQTSDAHPNVIRYYYQETRGHSLFIAIELCRASLADVIARPDQDQWKDIVINLDPKKALEEITSGLEHLHSLKIVHRDIKPQNILISGPLRTANSRNGKASTYRMLISDFGICKKLDDDQTSFYPTTSGPLAGTRGWLAPEFLLITLEKGSVNKKLGYKKLKKSLDIFPLGCLFYYTLTKGQHPYGRDFERDVNIMKDSKDVSGLDKFGEEGRMAKDLITKMLDPKPSQRPDASMCLEHHYFTDVSAPLDDHGSTTVCSMPSPLGRRSLQGRQREIPSHLKSLVARDESDRVHNPSTSKTTRSPAHPRSDEMTPEPQSEPPKWSVVYQPGVKRVLNFHVAHLFAYGSRVFCAKMSPNGQRLAIGLAYDGKTYVNDLKTGTKICVFVDRFVKDLIKILSVEFSPDGQLLATGASDSQIRIWDITTKRMRAMFKGHKSVVNSVAFSPNGRFLVTGSDDWSVRIWNIRDGSSKVLPVTSRAGCFISVAFSPNGRYIVGGNWNHSLWIWDSRKHTLLAKWWGHTNGVWSTKFTPDGRGLMSGSKDQTVKHWNLSSLGIQGALVGGGGRGFPEVRSFLGHTGPVRSIAFFPGGQWIVTGSADQTVRVWDSKSGVCQLTLQGHMYRVRGVDVSRTQNLLLTASDDGRVVLWRYELQNALS